MLARLTIVIQLSSAQPLQQLLLCRFGIQAYAAKGYRDHLAGLIFECCDHGSCACGNHPCANHQYAAHLYSRADLMGRFVTLRKALAKHRRSCALPAPVRILQSAALLAILDRLGVLADTEKKQLQAHSAPPIENSRGLVVGEIRAANSWMRA